VAGVFPQRNVGLEVNLSLSLARVEVPDCVKKLNVVKELNLMNIAAPSATYKTEGKIIQYNVY